MESHCYHSNSIYNANADLAAEDNGTNNSVKGSGNEFVPDGCDPCPNSHPDDNNTNLICDDAEANYCSATSGDGAQDNDSDGVCNADDKCNGTNFPVDDKLDTDADGTPNCNDNCPSDPAKTQPGTCGCGLVETIGCDGTTALALCGNGDKEDNDSDFAQDVVAGTKFSTRRGPIRTSS